DLANDEVAVEAAVALGNHDAFVGLHTTARAFDNVHADDHGVARHEGGEGFAEPVDFFLLEGLKEVHFVPENDLGRAALKALAPGDSRRSRTESRNAAGQRIWESQR